MAKTKSKQAAPESSKKTGTGGKVTKSGSKFEQAKATAKAVVAAAKPAVEKAQKTAKPVVDKAQEVAEVAGEKVKGILKNGTAQNIEKKKSKKKESDDESSSEEEESSSEEESSEEESESEEVKPKKGAAKVHPAAMKTAKKTSSSDEESSSESESEEESSESEEEDEAPKKKDVSKVHPAAKKPAESSSEESSSEGESSSEEESDEEEEAPKAKAAKTNGAKAPKANSDESSSEETSEEEESDEEESEDEETKPAVTAGQKRKEAPSSTTDTPVKRTKADSGGSVSIFVGNLSWNIDEDWLGRIFEEIGGVISARIITDRNTGRPKGFGYVDFETPEQAQAALKLKDTEVDGRAINIDIASSKPAGETPKSDRAQRFGDKISEPSATLFVGNLSFNSNEDSLYELFGQAGEISSVRIPTDKESGQVKGFAYVEFSDIDTAQKALNDFQGHYLDNRALRLDYSTPRNRDDSGRGGFGGGFGGRGGGGRGGGRGGFGGNNRGGFRGGRGGGGGGGRPGLGFRGGRGSSSSFQGRKTTF